MPQPKVMRWGEFSAMFLDGHKQGEHIAIVGQTGSGKTVLGLSLCEALGSRKTKNGRPAHVVVLVTKPRDDSVKKLGWPVIKEWPPAYGQEHCVVWPKAGAASGRAVRLRGVYQPLLDKIYSEGGQTVYIDEAAYFERGLPNGLGLGGTMEEFWTTARSSKLTLIGGTQRPRHVTRSMWSEPSWVFVFPPDDIDDLKRVAELSGRRQEVMEVAERLDGHEFLCIRRQRAGHRELYVSQVGK